MRTSLLLLVLFAGPAFAQETNPSITPSERARIDSIFAPFADPAAPGCAVGVYREGRIAYSQGYGGADLEHGVPITPRSRFYVASMSKQFTAAAVLLLVRQGRLGLDDDVRKYLPDLLSFATPITIRQLLNHTSGLRDYGALLQLADWPGAVLVGDEHFTPRQFRELVGRQRSGHFPPGTDWLYNNTGYVILADIVAKVTGGSFRQFADQAIFQPLGMNSSAFVDDHTELVPDRVIGYLVRNSPPKFKISESGADLVGHSGLVTTIEDLAKWSGNFSAPRVGDAALFTDLERGARLADGEELTYAMGLVRGSLLGRLTISHSGALGGFSTDFIRVPSLGLSVATLCNRRAPGATGLAERTLAVVMPAGTTIDSAAAARPVAKADSALAGVYVSANTDLWVRIGLAADGSLETESGNGRAPLTPRVDGTFTTDGTIWRFGADGRQLTADHKGLPPQTRYTRAAPPARKRTSGLAGRYWSDELQHAVEVSIKDSTVRILLTKSNDQIVLKEVAANWFVYRPLTVHFSPNGLSLTLYGARHVRYRKVP